jgi:cytochrome c peroxidase
MEDPATSSDALDSTTATSETSQSGESASESEAFSWSLPPGVDPPAIPADNPQTIEKVVLGRYLFYDVRLSADQNRACGICHEAAKGFTDGFPRANGTFFGLHARNTPTLTNVAYRRAYTWILPGLKSLETQMLIPFFNTAPHELGASGIEDEILARLRAEPLYPLLFAAAFPDDDEPLDLQHVIKAIAAFERTIISFDSPYDRYLRGDPNALDAQAQAGLALFESPRLGCTNCHSGPNFDETPAADEPGSETVNYYNIGLYNVDGEGSYPADGQGLFAHSGVPSDMGRFRTPTLRNVALSKPYMHDGTVPDLETVLDIFAAGGREITSNLPTKGDGRTNPFKHPWIHGFDINESERAYLIAFLHALTDETLIHRHDLQNPWPKTR